MCIRRSLLILFAAPLLAIDTGRIAELGGKVERDRNGRIVA